MACGQPDGLEQEGGKRFTGSEASHIWGENNKEKKAPSLSGAEYSYHHLPFG